MIAVAAADASNEKVEEFCRRESFSAVRRES